jgi:CRP-like cAMP-binding protein
LIRLRPAFELAPEQTREALARLPFLSSATPAQIDKLAQGVRSIRYGKGEILFHQNDPGDELFLISSGTLDIFVMNGRQVEEKIASVGVDSFVGERSLLTGEPRSATARAAGDCSVFVIGKVAMGELLREHPALAEQIAQTMAERDVQRHQLTRQMTDGASAAATLLQRIRAFFAIN